MLLMMGETALLNAFETLRDDTASEGELLDAVDEIAAADTEGVQAGKMTPVLSPQPDAIPHK